MEFGVVAATNDNKRSPNKPQSVTTRGMRDFLAEAPARLLVAFLLLPTATKAFDASLNRRHTSAGGANTSLSTATSTTRSIPTITINPTSMTTTAVHAAISPRPDQDRPKYRSGFEAQFSPVQTDALVNVKPSDVVLEPYYGIPNGVLGAAPFIMGLSIGTQSYFVCVVFRGCLGLMCK